jgi:hypothetical protein
MPTKKNNFVSHHFLNRFVFPDTGATGQPEMIFIPWLNFNRYEETSISNIFGANANVISASFRTRAETQ